MAPSKRSDTLGCAIGYLRVSTAEQAASGYGIEVQRQRIADFCRTERLELVATYEDAGVSGTLPLHDRDGLRAALEHVQRYGHPPTSLSPGGAQDPHSPPWNTHLVVARYDRLARDTLQALLIEREFQRAAATVLYAQGMNGDTAEMEFMRDVLHSFAKLEKRQLVSRLAAGRRAKANAGGYSGGRPRFGYEAVEGTLYPRDDEAEVVRWIFDRVARKGWTARQVTTALDRDRTLGRRWHLTQVLRILHAHDYKTGPPGGRIVDARIWNAAQVRLLERNAA